MTTSTSPTFTASGLASGLDTNSIIDNLVTIRSTQLTTLKANQTAFSTQVSAVADIANKMTALKTALQNLATNGALGVSAPSSVDGATITTSSAAQSGRYTLQVDSLATAAKARSTAIPSGTAITAGTLTIGIDGTNVDVNISNGTLADTAAAINAQATGVSATVLTNGTSSYLSITSRNTGFKTDPTLTFSGSAAAQFGLTSTTPATNAQLDVDGLTFTRQSNIVTDVLPGVTMSLTSASGIPQDLEIDNDAAATAKNLQTFVDAYNTIEKSISAQLNVAASSDRSSTLAGDSALRSLQGSMQSMTSAVVGTGSVRTLADLGIQTAQDGTLSLNSTTLATAIGRDPAAVNAVFSTASTGISAVGIGLVNGYTDPVDGVLTLRGKGLAKSVTDLDTEIDEAQRGVDAYRQQLTDQYAAMETLVSGFKSIASYLTSLSAAQTSK